jgi:hypothetical protein
MVWLPYYVRYGPCVQVVICLDKLVFTSAGLYDNLAPWRKPHSVESPPQGSPSYCTCIDGFFFSASLPHSFFSFFPTVVVVATHLNPR